MDLGFPVFTVALVILVIYLLSSIKILAEYERGVIFRLGRLLGHAKGPGVIFVFAPVDRIVRVSLRQQLPRARGQSHRSTTDEGGQRRWIAGAGLPMALAVEWLAHGALHAVGVAREEMADQHAAEMRDRGAAGVEPGLQADLQLGVEPERAVVDIG